MSTQVLRLAVNGATAEQMDSHSLRRVVEGFGEFPDAVFDFTEMRFEVGGVRLVVLPYRDAAALAAKVPLPTVDPIVLELSWEELRATPGAAALEGAVRDAAWALITSHPKMLRGLPPAEGEEDARVNAFDGGQLIEV